jgi:hypothetical protein
MRTIIIHVALNLRITPMKYIFTMALLLPSIAIAEMAEFRLAIKEHRFSPSEFEVPSGKKIRLTVVNQDATPEEFESHSLNREKLVSGNNSITIYIGPLEPGRYQFFGEFNEATARGVVISR